MLLTIPEREDFNCWFKLLGDSFRSKGITAIENAAKISYKNQQYSVLSAKKLGGGIIEGKLRRLT